MSLPTVISPVDVLNTIARSLVVAQEHASVEEALQAVALSEVRRKIAYYRQRIRALKRKHGTDFETFSARLSTQTGDVLTIQSCRAG